LIESEDFAGALLKSARSDEPSQEARAKAAAALGIAISAAPPVSESASPAVAGAAAGGKAIAVKLLVAALIGSTGIVAIARWMQNEPAPPPPAIVAPVIEQPAPAIAEAKIEPPPPVEPQLAPEEPAKTPRRAPVAKTKEPVKRTPTLDEEVALVDRARTAINAKDPAAALAAIREHRAIFSGGALVPEADALEIEATFAAGDRERASALKKAFDQKHPSSVLRGRLERLLR
jgi:hypothetical protein